MPRAAAQLGMNPRSASIGVCDQPRNLSIDAIFCPHCLGKNNLHICAGGLRILVTQEIAMFKKTIFDKTWFRGFMAAIAIGIGAGIVFASAAQANSLRIENKRGVALKELRITAKDNSGGQSFILASDLDARSNTSAKVPPGQCLFDVQGVFADDSQLNAEDMDLCRQKTIRLVE
jgi:hypothetical protein